MTTYSIRRLIAAVTIALVLATPSWAQEKQQPSVAGAHAFLATLTESGRLIYHDGEYSTRTYLKYTGEGCKSHFEYNVTWHKWRNRDDTMGSLWIDWERISSVLDDFSNNVRIIALDGTISREAGVWDWKNPLLFEFGSQELKGRVSNALNFLVKSCDKSGNTGF